MAVAFYIPAVLLGAISSAVVLTMGGTFLVAFAVYALTGALSIIGLAVLVYHRSTRRSEEGHAVSLSWPVGAAVHGGTAMLSQQD